MYGRVVWIACVDVLPVNVLRICRERLAVSPTRIALLQAVKFKLCVVLV